MKLIKSFFGLLILALAIWLLINWLHNKKEARELLSWIHVSVIEIDNSVPLGLLIEVENSGPRIIGKIHFRLVFSFGNDPLCRVDSDYGNFKPDEKRRILLKCKEEDVHRSNIQTSQKVSYYLQVFPEWKKGLEPIEGEFLLNQ